MFKDYRLNVLSSEYATHENEDALFDQNIEGLKRRAPEGTRFMKTRLQLESNSPDVTFWSIRRKLLHMFMYEPNSAPARDFGSCDINEIAQRCVEDCLG